MKKWLQKTLIVAVALLTFGAISPNHEIWTSLQDKDVSKHAVGSAQINDYSIGLADSLVDDSLEDNSDSIEELFITSAKKLSYMKFGTKIGPAITDEFDNIIFPKIEEAIQMTLASSGIYINAVLLSAKNLLGIIPRKFSMYMISRTEKILFVFMCALRNGHKTDTSTTSTTILPKMNLLLIIQSVISIGQKTHLLNGYRK